MPAANPAALDFLLSRRSRPAKTLGRDAPDDDAIRTLLTAAARTPDHGKLEPFRFLVIRGDAQERLRAAVEHHMKAANEPIEKIEKQAGSLVHGGLIIAVIASPKPSEKIPAWEQHLAAGGACLALLNAALAMGWGANWLTGWASECRPFMEDDLGLTATEFVAGFIHIGSETISPADRPRPDIDAISTWVEV
ncbi:MAG: nitroreductase family protein [Pseudomonadota bacterium]